MFNDLIIMNQFYMDLWVCSLLLNNFDVNVLKYKEYDFEIVNCMKFRER